MAIQVGSDGFLQLVVRGRLLEPQAQIVLQVLVQLVTWKEQVNIEMPSVEKEANEEQIPSFLTE